MPNTCLSQSNRRSEEELNDESTVCNVIVRQAESVAVKIFFEEVHNKNAMQIALNEKLLTREDCWIYDKIYNEIILVILQYAYGLVFPVLLIVLSA